jgi:hypothetical protein
VRRAENHEALAILEELGIYVCFNLLLFDPDTTEESLETNLGFLDSSGDSPSNFGRVELYAGTPLLARMRAEGRSFGDYLGHDYRLATPALQRVFELAMRCFHARNFAPGALANRLMGTHFDVHVARHFHPEVFDQRWTGDVRALSRELARDSAAGLREIMAFVRARGPAAPAQEFVDDLSSRLRAREESLRARARDIELCIQRRVQAACNHSRDALPRAGGLCQVAG